MVSPDLCHCLWRYLYLCLYCNLILLARRCLRRGASTLALHTRHANVQYALRLRRPHSPVRFTLSLAVFRIATLPATSLSSLALPTVSVSSPELRG